MKIQGLRRTCSWGRKLSRFVIYELNYFIELINMNGFCTGI